MDVFEIIIVGGGASGLFLAANLKKDAIILEQNEMLGKKLLISGGNKCNLTNENISKDAYLCDNYELLEKTLDNFSFRQNLDFFKNINFKKIRNQQFFAPNSKLILNAILEKIKAKIYLNTKVLELKKSEFGYKIITNKGEFRAKKVVIASGAISYSTLGVSDVALKIADEFSLKYSDFAPALVPFTLQKDEFFMKNLSGISVDVKINKNIKGSLLFTHKGLSGPAALSASVFWQKGKIAIDFLNDFKIDYKNNKQASTHLPLPKAFVKEYLKANKMPDLAMNKFNNEQKNIINKLHNYEFSPAGTLGFNRAEICKGGVFLTGLSDSFEGEKNLFFIGECLNVAGILGGYNIHFAFASAKKLANYLNKN